MTAADNDTSTGALSYLWYSGSRGLMRLRAGERVRWRVRVREMTCESFLVRIYRVANDEGSVSGHSYVKSMGTWTYVNREDA